MRPPFYFFSVVLTLFLIAGCSTTPPAQHYFIAPLAEPAGTDKKLDLSSDRTTIEVQVRIPRYIDRPQIVTRIGPNEFRLDEFNRWAGSVKDNITTVVIQNLKALMPDTIIARRPIPSVLSIDYVVFVDVVQFDGVIGKDVTIMATWGILDKDDKTDPTLQVREFSTTESVESKSYASLVAAKSRILANLSQEIVQALEDLQAGKHAKMDD